MNAKSWIELAVGRVDDQVDGEDVAAGVGDVGETGRRVDQHGGDDVRGGEERPVLAPADGIRADLPVETADDDDRRILHGEVRILHERRRRLRGWCGDRVARDSVRAYARETARSGADENGPSVQMFGDAATNPSTGAKFLKVPSSWNCVSRPLLGTNSVPSTPSSGEPVIALRTRIGSRTCTGCPLQ